MDRFLPPPDLCLSTCKEFIVHGTISYVMFQNIIITTVLETGFSPSDFCPYKKLLVCPLHGKPYQNKYVNSGKKGYVVYIKTSTYANSGENETAVHIETSMLLLEITGMLYIGNRQIRFVRVLQSPRDSTK